MRIRTATAEELQHIADSLALACLYHRGQRMVVLRNDRELEILRGLVDEERGRLTLDAERLTGGTDAADHPAAPQ